MKRPKGRWESEEREEKGGRKKTEAQLRSSPSDPRIRKSSSLGRSAYSQAQSDDRRPSEITSTTEEKAKEII